MVLLIIRIGSVGEGVIDRHLVAHGLRIADESRVRGEHNHTISRIQLVLAVVGEDQGLGAVRWRLVWIDVTQTHATSIE
jgi:hypothetical protein